MASIKPTPLPMHDWIASRGVSIYQWKDVGPDDECLPAEIATEDDVSVQVSGVLDGATVIFTGTLDSAIPATPLLDRQNNDIAIFAYPTGYQSAMAVIADPVRLLTPVIRGSGKPCVTITLMARK